MKQEIIMGGQENITQVKNVRQGGQTIMEKLKILADGAKYDVSCSSSGVERKGNGVDMGNCAASGFVTAFRPTEDVFRC